MQAQGRYVINGTGVAMSAESGRRAHWTFVDVDDEGPHPRMVEHSWSQPPGTAPVRAEPPGGVEVPATPEDPAGVERTL